MLSRKSSRSPPGNLPLSGDLPGHAYTWGWGEKEGRYDNHWAEK